MTRRSGDNCIDLLDESIVESNSEVLWSHDGSHGFTENSFLGDDEYECSDFFNLTGRSTSSCSWHNDDFDMKAGNKVSLSLDAIENALYEQEQSEFISKEVFEVCLEWANKFPYFRLKGRQILTPSEDNVTSYPPLASDGRLPFSDSMSGLQLTGKSMAIHSHGKHSSQMKNKDAFGIVNRIADSDEVIEDDGKYEEFFALDTGKASSTKHNIDEQTGNLFKLLEEKVIEKIALEIWPKVVSILENCDVKPTKEILACPSDGFQLPPISALVEQRQNLTRRPRTEGANIFTPEHSHLTSFITVSPKILQNRYESGNGRVLPRSARPSSEIRPSRKSITVANNVQRNSPFRSSELSINKISVSVTKKIQPIITRIQEKSEDGPPVFLPVLEEDFEQFNVLKTSTPGTGHSEITYDFRSMKRPDSFLPPIDSKGRVATNAKYARNLFTYFEPQLQSDKSKRNSSICLNPKTSTSRPTTGASQKISRHSAISNHRFHSNDCQNNFDTRKPKEGNTENQVMFFPIVTPLVPNRDQSASSRKRVSNANGRNR